MQIARQIEARSLGLSDRTGLQQGPNAVAVSFELNTHHAATSLFDKKMSLIFCLQWDAIDTNGNYSYNKT